MDDFYKLFDISDLQNHFPLRKDRPNFRILWFWMCWGM